MEVQLLHTQQMLPVALCRQINLVCSISLWLSSARLYH